MMQKKLYRFGLFVLIICMLLGLSSCLSVRMREYYGDRNNYLSAKGTVSHVSYDEESGSLYIDFSQTMPLFDDTCFKIVGDSYNIVKTNGIEHALKIGSEVTFTTAPHYFGDGYVMPLVSISVGEDTFLEFDEGFSNLMKWLGE